MPTPIAVVYGNVDSSQVDVTPSVNRTAGTGFYEDGVFLISHRDLVGGSEGSAYDSGRFRCKKQTTTDVFAIGDTLSFSTNGVIAGTDLLEVVKASSATDSYVIAELRNYGGTDADQSTGRFVAGLPAIITAMLPKLDTHAAQADDYSTPETLQAPYYGSAIFGQALVNAAQALRDPTYLEPMFNLWDVYKSTHNVTLTVDGGHSADAEYGYSNPQTPKGAQYSTYYAVENGYMLNLMEWANAVWELSVRIIDGDFATDQQKARARGYCEWVTRHTVERYMTSSFWNDLNIYLERFAANDNQDGNGRNWDDKFAHAGTACAYIDYFYPIWGLPLPPFLTQEGLPTGRPQMDYKRWYRFMIGVALANEESTEYYGDPVVGGSVILPNGSSYLPPNDGVTGADRYDDWFHDARRYMFSNAIERTQAFEDEDTRTYHNLHMAGYRELMKNMIYHNGTCWDTYYRTNSTDDEEQADGGKKPVWHWGRLVLGDNELQTLLTHVVDGAQLDPSDPCYLAGYDSQNLANIYSWLALAESGVDSIMCPDFEQPPTVASTAALRDPESAANKGRHTGQQLFNTTSNQPVYSSGSNVSDTWHDTTGAVAVNVVTHSSYGLFDGVDDCVTRAAPVSALPVTMCAWIRTTKDGVAVCLADASLTNRFWRLEVWGGKAAATTNSGTIYRALSNGTVVDGIWHHIAAVFGTTTSRKIYVDGVLQSESTDSSTPTGIDVFEAGRSGDSTPSLYFTGRESDVRLYSAALSDNNILYLATSGTSGVDAGTGDLELQWAFDDGDGVTVADSTANSYDGTATNTTASTFFYPYTG